MKSILKNLYRKFNKNYQQEYLLKNEFKYLENCKNILDIGCGTGDFIELSPEKISGIDINHNSIKICKKKKYAVKIGNATKVPFKKKSFEGIHASHIIEHLLPNDAVKFLSEVSRVLKLNGVFVLSTPILWRGFYDDFTHIKPYNPNSVRRFFNQTAKDKTMKGILYEFKEIDFYWRYEPIPYLGKYLYLIVNYLYKYNIHWLTRNGYTIVLKKIK